MGAPLDAEVAELLDVFHLEDVQQQFENDIKYKQSELDREKRRKEKLKSNSTNDTQKVETKTENPEELSKIEKPKLKFSIELSRSGYILIPKATIGSMVVEIKHIRKPS